MKRDGLTLLETMVALVILGLVVVAYLEVFAATTRTVRNAETWSQAVAYAENAMEVVKIDPRNALAGGSEQLGGGFERQVETRHWSEGIQLVTVRVSLPDGGRFTLNRLIEIQ